MKKLYSLIIREVLTTPEPSTFNRCFLPLNLDAWDATILPDSIDPLASHDNFVLQKGILVIQGLINVCQLVRDFLPYFKSLHQRLLPIYVQFNQITDETIQRSQLLRVILHPRQSHILLGTNEQKGQYLVLNHAFCLRFSKSPTQDHFP
jgi:hypothetical protein